MSQEKESKALKKITEIRKKISLCEGKRRAVYSLTEKEKSLNREKTFLLQEELKVEMNDGTICTIFCFVDSKTILEFFTFHKRQYPQEYTEPASPGQKTLWEESNSNYLISRCLNIYTADLVPALPLLCWTTRFVTSEGSWIN